LPPDVEFGAIQNVTAVVLAASEQNFAISKQRGRVKFAGRDHRGQIRRGELVHRYRRGQAYGAIDGRECRRQQDWGDRGNLISTFAAGP